MAVKGCFELQNANEYEALSRFETVEKELYHIIVMERYDRIAKQVNENDFCRYRVINLRKIPVEKNQSNGIL